jgi:hypothetical protein
MVACSLTFAVTVADRVAPQHCKEESLRLLIKKVNHFEDDLPSVGGTLLSTSYVVGASIMVLFIPAAPVIDAAASMKVSRQSANLTIRMLSKIPWKS